MFRLNNKIAAVTGGGSGIGQAVAKTLAARGAMVHVIDLSAEAGAGTANSIKEEGGEAIAHACDVSDQRQVKKIFDTIGGLGILVNNAGIAHVGNAENTQEEDFQKVFNVNVKGVYNCMHAALPIMKKNGSGVIINLSSIAAHVCISERFAYSMSKGAVHAMTLSVAKDFLKEGIRCNSISPARVHTPFVDGFLAKNYPGHEAEMFQKLSASQPIGRMGTVEEIAQLVLYLASDEASFITGMDYPIDGGFITLNN
ncbi:MAG TPA: glucose 1-dehydrogenase [Chitinophagaceae bacterium]|nr:glucose 1-dehydrogenase [Chitinophagaceae bacterium]